VDEEGRLVLGNVSVEQNAGLAQYQRAGAALPSRNGRSRFLAIVLDPIPLY
jgi:hypothetical protein